MQVSLEDSSPAIIKEPLHHVITVEDPKGFRNFLLHNMTYSLGRGVENLIVLRSNLVSRQHAMLLTIASTEGSSYFFRIIDGNLNGTRSTNGILINGKRRLSHILCQGDEILFSKDTRVVYQVISAISHAHKEKLTDKLEHKLKGNFYNGKSLIASTQKISEVGSIHFSKLQIIAKQDLSINMRNLIDQFSASPQLNPQPIIDLSLSRKMLYFNPAALQQFPDLDTSKLDHPLLQDLSNQLTPLLTLNNNFFIREVKINDRVFEQIIHFKSWNDIARLHICDITKQKQSEEIISYQIHFDNLTDLPNRKYLHDHLFKITEKTQDKHQRFAILFLDIDRFKLINDSLGHAIGDLLLKAVSDRLKALIKKGDLLVRWGSDEFAIVTKKIESSDAVVQVAESIIQTLTLPFVCGGHELHITTCIGISIYPDHNTDVDELIRNADMAMYRAKTNGQNVFQFYIPNMQEQSFQKLTMENNLRRALENEELETYYQPQVDLITNKIVGLEVLLRWKHVTLGSISPAKFIPLAEETGLIIAMGSWVLKHSCLQAIAWQNMGLEPIQIGVNLSIKQLQQKDFLASLKQMLEETV